MLIYPPVIALVIGSLLISSMLLHASFYGIQILRRWDINSGSDLQLRLERKTYLISTIISYAFGFQLISLFLYIYTTDDLCRLFVGAMCAAGTLFVNDFGYPTLVLKIVNFLLAGFWLVLNYTDNRAYDYPLIRKKYFFLLVITPFILTETVLQTKYFLGMNPNIITSCCGALFSTDTKGLASEILSFPSIPMKYAFYGSMALSVLLGAVFCLKQRGAYLFSLVSGVTFLVSLAALISFISLYFYELPTHHCPFCILQKEYGYVGYPLYLTLLGGAVSGVGVGLITPFRMVTSLSRALPRIQKRLALTSLDLYLVFTVIVTFRMVFTSFKLEGY
jgi:hypothetical protein